MSFKKERERGRMVMIEKREGERENGYHLKRERERGRMVII